MEETTARGPDSNEQNTTRVIVLGSPTVGKSALIVRFTTGDYVEDYDPTIEDSHRIIELIDEQKCVLEIIDTAATMSSRWITSGHGFVLVYSVADATSLASLDAIRGGIYKLKGANADVPMVVCGNKVGAARNAGGADVQIPSVGCILAANIPCAERQGPGVTRWVLLVG